MTEEIQSTAEVIRDLSRPTLQQIHDHPVLIIQDGQKTVQFPDLMPRPARTKAKLVAMDVDGFISYVNEYKIARTRIFATTVGDNFSMTAVIDYHYSGEDPSAPSHCEHSIVCPMLFSEEWNRWTSRNSRLMSQKEFGEFIEDNLSDIASHQSTALLNAALNFSVSRKVEFRSVQRLSDNTIQFNYSEGDNSQQAALPTEIEIAIPVFTNGTKYALSARLKYSLTSTELKIWYEIIRPDKIIELAMKAVLLDVQQKVGIPPMRVAVQR